jgi:hypothetical protein
VFHSRLPFSPESERETAYIFIPIPVNKSGKLMVIFITSPDTVPHLHCFFTIKEIVTFGGPNRRVMADIFSNVLKNPF